MTAATGSGPSVCLLGLHYEHGGLAHHVENLAAGLSRSVPTSVIALRPDRGRLANAPQVRFRHLPLPLRRWPTVQASLLCAAAGAVGALTDAEVIHAHHPLPAALLSAAALRRCVVQTVHHIPSLDLGTMGAGVRRTRLVAAARILERYAWTRVAALIVVHRELSDWIVANLPVDRARIHVIPNGVDAARFRPDHEARSLVRRRLGLPEDAFLAISMKSLHKDDLPTVLRAVAAIDEPRFRLLVPWRDATSSLPKIVGEAGARNVIVVPKIPYAEMAGYYSAADLVIVPYLKKEYGVAATEPDGRTEPSLREACRAGYASVTSLAAMEALASGTPTIVSVPGATGSPSPSDIGTAVRAWDHRALADAVQAMIDDPSAAKAMAENARRFVGEEFSWERIAERTVKAYRRAAG